MFIDSHCHLDFPDLAKDLPELLQQMQHNQVTHALCVSVNLPDFPRVRALAETHENLFASVGVHPDYEEQLEPKAEELAELALHPKVIAIGETGLDYFRLQGDLELLIVAHGLGADAPHRRLDVLTLERRHHILGRQVEGGQLAGVQPDPHAVIQGSKQEHFTHAWDPGQGIHHVDGGVITQK